MKLLAFLIIPMLALLGCNRSAVELDESDEKNPHYISGRQKLTARDYRGASADFEKALEIQPHNALCHFELGRLLDGDDLKPNNLPGAIYHYQKFISLRPQSQKVELVRGFIRDDLIRLAATVPHSNVVPPQEVARLQGENEALRAENEDLRTRLDQVTTEKNQSSVAKVAQPGIAIPHPSPDLPTSSSPKPPAPVAPAAEPGSSSGSRPSAGRKYTVQKGDTLSSISRKFYGSPALAEKLYSANRAALPDKNKLAVGQVISIPTP